MQRADLDRVFYKFRGENQFKHYVDVTYVAVDWEPQRQPRAVAPERLLKTRDLDEFGRRCV